MDITAVQEVNHLITSFLQTPILLVQSSICLQIQCIFRQFLANALQILTWKYPAHRKSSRNNISMEGARQKKRKWRRLMVAILGFLPGSKFGCWGEFGCMSTHMKFDFK